MKFKLSKKEANALLELLESTCFFERANIVARYHGVDKGYELAHLMDSAYTKISTKLGEEDEI